VFSSILLSLQGTSTVKQRAHFTVQDLVVEEREWRRGYWQQPTWRQPPVQPGQVNEIIRKYRTLMGRFQGQLPRVQEPNLEDLCARDEERLAKALEHKKKKRKAVKDAAEPDVSL